MTDDADTGPRGPDDSNPGGPIEAVDLNDPSVVAAALLRGAEACRDARCRQGSIEVITAPGRVIASGDLHDNPVHLGRLVELAELPLGLVGSPFAAHQELCSPDFGSHLTLHELIHSDRLVGGMDFSFRVLTRIAALKAFAPERVHVLLANHELAQIAGSGVVKNGVRCVDAFNEAIDHTFAEDAGPVHEAVNTFIRAMPLALRCSTPHGDLLCSHSLPAPGMMASFDTGILSRELTEEDYVPRVGSAYKMVWGRGYDADQLEDLTERWGINLYILGHEHAHSGVAVVEPNAVVLNSDHERGVCLPIDLDEPIRAHDAPSRVVRLSQGV
ncbi:MAG: hypothetical protein AAGG07_09110 [Planctomycetota bacterium]